MEHGVVSNNHRDTGLRHFMARTLASLTAGGGSPGIRAMSRGRPGLPPPAIKEAFRPWRSFPGLKVQPSDLSRWFFRLIGVLLISGSLAKAAVVHKIDDSTVTGTFDSIADQKAILKSPAATIPLDQISQIVFKEPPPPPEPKPVTPAAQNQNEDDNVTGALLSALFGSSHHHADDQEATPATAPAATAATKPASTAPTSAPVVTADINQSGQFTFTDGDQCHATLLRWQDQKLSLKLASGSLLDMPSSVLSEIWLGSPDLMAKAKKLSVDAGPEDVAFVARDDGVIAVKGFAAGINSASLLFRYDNQVRRINRSKVVGLLLRSNSPAPITAFHQLIHTDAGDQFSGTLTGIDRDLLAISSPSGAQLEIPLSDITTIDFVNGKVTCLTDLTPTRVEQTPYFGRLIPYRINESLAGGPITLSDGPCPRGIAVHSRCVLDYDVSSGFDRFKTRLGFEQPDGQLGRVLARVLGDGKVLYENPDARGNQPPIDIDVPVTGVHTLTLEIDFGKDQDVGDRLVWGNPRLLRGK